MKNIIIILSVWVILTIQSGQAAYMPVPQKSAVTVQTTGFTMTIADAITIQIINNAALVATGTVTLPPNPTDGMPLTIESPKGITLLTLNANTGQTISGPAIITAGVSVPIRLKWSGINSTWYPN